jgi:hypothetical protein
MKNNYFKFVIFLLALISLSSIASDNLGCYDELRGIVESSSSLKLKNKYGLVVALVIDTDENNIITAQLRLVQESSEPKNEDEWQGSQIAGWIKFYENEGLLYELPPNEDESLVRLETKFSLIEKFKRCRNAQRNAMGDIANERYFRVISKGRSYFYGAPEMSRKSKHLFLVRGDTVKMLEVLGEFILVSYTQKSGNIVEGWLKKEDLQKIEKRHQGHTPINPKSLIPQPPTKHQPQD